MTHVDPVEGDAPVGSGPRRDEPVAMFAGGRHRRVGGGQGSHHFCRFLHRIREEKLYQMRKRSTLIENRVTAATGKFRPSFET